MRNKKGFTLIELLAVIVVLALIAVITVPIINDMLSDARKGTVKNSAYGYKRGIDNFNYDQSFDDSEFELGDRRYTSLQLKNLGVSVSGKEPDTNSWVDIVDGEVIDGCLQFGNYMVYVGYDYVGDVSKGECDIVGEWSQTVFPIVSKTIGDTSYYDASWVKSNPVYYNPVDNSICSLSDSSSAFGNSSGCMKWYAYSETDGRVNLLLDHNITNEEWNLENINQSKPNGLLNVLDETTSNWSDRLLRHDSYSVMWDYDGHSYSFSIDYSGKKARLISAEEVAALTGISSWSSSDSLYYFGSGKDTGYLNQNSTEQLRQESFSWLFDNMNDCDQFGCESGQDNAFSYWTSTPRTNTSNEVWCICNEGCLDTNESNTSWIGLRPVISVSKSTVY